MATVNEQHIPLDVLQRLEEKPETEVPREHVTHLLRSPVLLFRVLVSSVGW